MAYWTQQIKRRPGSFSAPAWDRYRLCLPSLECSDTRHKSGVCSIYSSSLVLQDESVRRASLARTWHWCEQYRFSGEPQNSRPQIEHDFFTCCRVRGIASLYHLTSATARGRTALNQAGENVDAVGTVRER